MGGEILTSIPNITSDASLARLEDLVSPSVFLLLCGKHEAVLSYIELSCQLLQLAILIEYFVGYRLEVTVVFGSSG